MKFLYNHELEITPRQRKDFKIIKTLWALQESVRYSKIEVYFL
jgi:hypothetical protein